MRHFFNSPQYLELEASRVGGEPRSSTLDSGSVINFIARRIPQTNLFDGVSVYGYPDLDQRSPQQSTVDPKQLIQEFSAKVEEHAIVSAYFRMGLHQNVGAPWRTDFADCGQVGEAVVIDLKRSWDEIFMSFRSRLRSQLRNADRLTIDFSDDIVVFHRMYIENMRRVGARESYLFSLDYLRSMCTIDGAELIIARDEKGPVSGAITLAHGPALYYHLGATGERGFGSSPLRQVLAWLAEHHAGGAYDQMVLGGGLGGANDELMRFKRGYSKDTLPVFGLKVVCNSSLYKELSGTDPVTSFEEGFFPKYRTPSV